MPINSWLKFVRVNCENWNRERKINNESRSVSSYHIENYKFPLIKIFTNKKEKANQAKK